MNSNYIINSFQLHILKSRYKLSFLCWGELKQKLFRYLFIQKLFVFHCSDINKIYWEL